MFHVERRDRDGQIRQAIRRFSSTHEYLGATAMQILQHALLMRTVQFRCEVIQLQHRPHSVLFSKLSSLRSFEEPDLGITPASIAGILCRELPPERCVAEVRPDVCSNGV